MNQKVMSQKEAVTQAIHNVIGEVDGKYEPTKEERAQVTDILVEGFKAHRIALKETAANAAKLADESELRAYCSGLVSNWLRKNTALNGGIKYTPKNPGSRAGSTDPQIKAMRTLLATRTDLTDEDKAEIQAAITKRQGEIKPAKVVELSNEQVEVLKAAGFSKFFNS